jgi:hypothetical protein
MDSKSDAGKLLLTIACYRFEKSHHKIASQKLCCLKVENVKTETKARKVVEQQPKVPQGQMVEANPACCALSVLLHSWQCVA